ncbi:MAG: PEP-CTERM sorting domain-containing protein [Akkermansiaceae bacterium]|nr:PEP-CTERM sorting domain-containing protein [Akkermansiaceae bacterium]
MKRKRMKTGGVTALACCAMAASHTDAALSAYDGFTTTGDLTGQTGGSGFTGAWGSSDQSLTVVSGTLSYSTLVTTGGKVEANSTDELEFRGLPSTSTGTVWMSALMQVNGTSNITSNMASIGLFTGTTSQRTWLAVRQGQVQFYTRNAADTAWDINNSTSYTNGDTVFLVSRIQYGAGTGGSDLVDYWVNPALGASLTSGDITVDNSGVAFDSIRISGSGGTGGTNTPNYIDEIRFGNSYAEVAPVPEPSSAALLGLAGLALILRRRK